MKHTDFTLTPGGDSSIEYPPVCSHVSLAPNCNLEPLAEQRTTTFAIPWNHTGACGSDEREREVFFAKGFEISSTANVASLCGHFRRVIMNIGLQMLQWGRTGVRKRREESGGGRGEVQRNSNLSWGGR